MSVYVFGDYSRYIPYYVYSILKSYPEYYVIVFYMGHLSESEKESLNRIKDQLSSNFEIKEGYYKHLDYLNRKIKKALRFLIPYKEFKEFENVYIGDVDFLILNEKPGLLQEHLEHSKKIGLPFSNKIRNHSKRLTGLHFIRTDAYYSKMETVISSYLNNIDKLTKDFKTLKNIEEFLYKIVNETFGYGKINEYPFRPHHGIHLGMLRKNQIKDFDKYIKNENKTPHRLPPLSDIKEQLSAFYKDDLFKELLKINPIPEMDELTQKLGF